MPTTTNLTYPYTLTNSTTADATEVQADFNAVSTLLNSTGIGTNNIKDASITAAKMDTDSVATAAIVDANVTTAKLATNAVTTVKITDLNVTTAKIADGAVTPAKKAVLGQQISASCGSASGTSASFTNIGNQTVTITTTGRPVWVGLQADGGSTAASIGGASTTTAIRFQRDSTAISVQYAVSGQVPASAFWHIDTPAAGTYTYTAQAQGTSMTLQSFTLVAFEL